MSTAKKKPSLSQAPSAPAAARSAPAQAEGPPVYDAATAQRAYEKLSGWYKSFSEAELQQLDVEVDQAVLAALALSSKVSEDELSAKFHALPMVLFDVAVLDHLPQAAWALWYASRQCALAAGSSPEAQRWGEAQRRAWTFLLGTYNEIIETGWWLERGNKRRQELFPPLRPLARAPASAQKSGERPTPS